MTFKECMGKVGEFFKKFWQIILIPIGFVVVVLMTGNNRKEIKGEIKELEKEVKEDKKAIDSDIEEIKKAESALEQAKKEAEALEKQKERLKKKIDNKLITIKVYL